MKKIIALFALSAAAQAFAAPLNREPSEDCATVAKRAAQVVEKVNMPNVRIRPISAVLIDGFSDQETIRVTLKRTAEYDDEDTITYVVDAESHGGATCFVNKLERE